MQINLGEKIKELRKRDKRKQEGDYPRYAAIFAQ